MGRSVLFVGGSERVAPGAAAGAPDGAEAVAREEAIARLADSARPVDVVVVAAGTTEPLSLAQEAQARDQDVAIVVLATAGDAAQLTKALRFAPFLGEDVACLRADNGDVSAELAAAAERTRRRRELRVAAQEVRVAPPADTASQAERYLGQLLAHAPLGVVATDATGAIVGWNARAGEILDASEDDVVGMPLCRLFPEPERDRADDFIAHSRAAEDHAPSEVFQRTTRAGAEQFLEATAIPVTGRDEEAGVLVLLRDVTVRVRAEEERRSMEEALRFQKTLLESQSEASTEGTLVVSREGRILFVNRRFCELWEIPDPGGHRSGDAARRALAEKITMPADFLERFDALASSKERMSRETVELADGRSYETYSGPVATDEGVHYGRVWFFRDVSDLKRIEAQLHARAREQAAVAWLGQRALAAKDLGVLMDEAVALVADTLRVEYAKVLELAPDGERLLLRAGVGWNDGLVGSATVGAGRESQAGYTLLSEEPVVVEDLRTEERFAGPPLLHEHGVVSGMSVVIGGREPAFGVLGTHTATRRPFTSNEINFLRAVANVVGAAIERDEADRVRAELQSVTDAALAHLSLDDLLDELLSAIAALLATDTITILLLDEETNELVPRASEGFDELVESAIRVPFGKGLGGRIASERRALTLEDVPDAFEYNPILREKGLESMLGVPLIVEGRVTGVAYVGTFAPRAFTDEDTRLLQLVADRVALAIEQCGSSRRSEARARRRSSRTAGSRS